MAAPVNAIIGYDLKFDDQLPKLFLHNNAARSWFTVSEEHARTTAFRNGSYRGAYFILAARPTQGRCLASTMPRRSGVLRRG